MLNFRTIVLTTIMATIGISEAFAAEANCFCVVSRDDLTNKTSSSGVVINYSPLGGSYSGVFPANDENQTNCNTRCTNHAGPRLAEVQAASCSAGVAAGVFIRAFSAIGTKEYKTAHYFGTIKRTNNVYSCPQGGVVSGANCIDTKAATASCPSGYWNEFTATSKKCVKQACPANSMPGVAAWAAIGGAVNGGQYLSDNAGGSRFFIDAKLSCDSGYVLSGFNCVKTYAATLVSPATCTLSNP